MSDIGKAYVRIVPSAEGISGSISSVLDKESGSAGKSAGFNIAGAIKGAIAAAGIGTVIKSSLEAGGNLQQSFGGLDTLYGQAAEGAKKYAVEAAKAGISANDYAEQAVSFGASLKQAFAGDTQKAMEAANTAILDMTDNAAKMGTPVENIQNAYQGFAKQNYTMLDNLKLGYGGTKSEMERLLADATKLSGVKYNLDNLGDVYSAIHVIQQNLGLTGVAAAEAAETFTGSLGAMKAAGENLLANLSLGEDIGPSLDALKTTVSNFVFGNLLPMVGNMLEAVPELISGLGSMVVESLNIVSQNSDGIVKTGLEIVLALADAIIKAVPSLIGAAWNLATSLGEALINTDWTTVGNNLLQSLKDGIDLTAKELFGTDTATIDSFIEGLMSGLENLIQSGGELLQGIYDGVSAALPTIYETGTEIISQIATGILENLPSLITTAGDLIVSFADFLGKNFPVLLENGMTMLTTLADGVVKSLPAIGQAALEVIAKLIATIASNLPQILETGITVILKMIEGLLKAIPKIIAAIPQIITAIKDTFGQYDWGKIGNDILNGVKNGILGAIDGVVNAAIEAGEAIWDAVTGFFDIGSPSKKMKWVGKMDMIGLADGIAENESLVANAFDDVADDMTSKLQVKADYGNLSKVQSGDSQLVLNMTINGAEGQDINALADLIQERIAASVERRKLVYA